jgi:DNA-binding transcriptional ArsR family regulator
MAGLDEAFAALSDPTRRRVLRLVASRPRPAGQIAEAFPVSRPAISKHLRVLREAGLVEVDRIGRTRMYRLRPGGIAEARRWMIEAERFWDRALEAFRRRVEEEVDS